MSAAFCAATITRPAVRLRPASRCGKMSTHEAATPPHHGHRQLPVPGWLEFASQHLDQFGPDDVRRDAGRRRCRGAARPGGGGAGRHHRRRADAARLQPLVLRLHRGHRPGEPPRRGGSGPPAHDQRGKHKVAGELRAPRGLGAVEEFERLQRLAPAPERRPGSRRQRARAVHAERPAVPNERYKDRYALTEALLPIVRAELEALVAGGLPRDHGGRAVDELLRPPRGPAAVRRHLQPHGRAGRRQVPPLARTSASAITRPAPSARAATRRCSRRFWT